MQEEIWRDIKGFEGLYQVSNLGRVKSVERLTIRNGRNYPIKEKLLSLHHDKDGYIVVSLSNLGKSSPYKVHRLVCEAFLPNPENKPCVDHISTIKDDNRVENLRWCTHKENCNNPISHQKLLNTIQPRYSKDNPNAKAIIQFTTNGEVIRKWNCMDDAAKAFNVHYIGISKCCRGVLKTAYGYVWKYYNTFFMGDMIYTIKTRVA